MDWQPIETAPKDGTHIILANAEDTTVGFFSYYLGLWETFDGLVGPSHWMPLPPPPGGES